MKKIQNIRGLKKQSNQWVIEASTMKSHRKYVAPFDIDKG